jgi:hypothetical protein
MELSFLLMQDFAWVPWQSLSEFDVPLQILVKLCAETLNLYSLSEADKGNSCIPNRLFSKPLYLLKLLGNSTLFFNPVKYR